MRIAIVYCGTAHIKSLIDRCQRSETQPILVSSTTPAAEMMQRCEPKGIIITGSPLSVLNPESPTIDPAVYEIGIPTLGICYGMQRMAKDLGGDVVRFPKPERDVCLLEANIEHFSNLYQGFTVAGVDVWMSHSCQVRVMPEGFVGTGSTKETAIASMERDHLYAVQYHPEKVNHGSGKQIMNNFFHICREHADAV